MMLEVSGAVSDSEFSIFASVSLSDTDFFVQFFEKPFLFEHVQCRDKVSVAGTAGIYFLDSISYFYNFAAFRDVLLNIFTQYVDVRFGNVGTANAKFSGKFYIGNVRNLVVELLTDIGIYEYRIHCCPDAVHHNRISTILKIQVAADIVDYDKILMDACI